MKNINVIIAAAGPITKQILPISSNIPTTMIPVNGKPLIGWIIDWLYTQDLKNTHIAIGPAKDQMINYIGRIYKNKMNINFAFPDKDYGLAYTVYYTLKRIDNTDPVLIVLGDTIFKEKLEFNYDWVKYSKVEETFRWCFVEYTNDNYVKKYIDKPDNYKSPGDALIGLYYLTDKNLLEKSLKYVVDNDIRIKGEMQLSSALAKYGKVKPIKAEETNEWYDCGSVDNYHKTKRNLLISRSFNSVIVDDTLGIITKKSKDHLKFNDEINWYLQLPKELQVLTPRIIDYKLSDRIDESFITMEYYGYSALSEIWLYENLHFDIWRSILNHLVKIISLFKKYTSRLSVDDFVDVYWNKTTKRFENYVANSSNPDFFQMDRININEEEYFGFNYIKSKIRDYVDEIYNKDDISIIHGDFCFSNILYDLNNKVVKLLDPRGSFGEKGIYGDIKYDLAKLRHSINGKYDFLIYDLFEIKFTKEEVKTKVYFNGIHQKVDKYFDELIVKEGYKLNHIKFIEGLLFISMLPLHPESFETQLAMYCQGIVKLNQVLI